MAKKINMLPLLAIAGGAALLLAKKSKVTAKLPSSGDHGVYVDAGCPNLKIGDEEMFESFITSHYEAMRDGGVTDPFEIANAIFEEIAPDCPYYPNDMEGAGSIDIYSRLVAMASTSLWRDDVITMDDLKGHPNATDYTAWLNEHKARYELPGGNDVYIVGDGEGIIISQGWAQNVLFPFISKSYAEGSFIGKLPPVITYEFMASHDAILEDNTKIPLSDLKETEAYTSMFTAIIKIVGIYENALEETGQDSISLKEMQKRMGEEFELEDFCKEERVGAEVALVPGCIIAATLGLF